jgi:hypothetical protein
MRRIVSLWLAQFPVERLIRDTPELSASQPLVLVQAGARGLRLAACSPAALACGLRPGERLADARARVPHLVARRHEPERDVRARRDVLQLERAVDAGDRRDERLAGHVTATIAGRAAGDRLERSVRDVDDDVVERERPVRRHHRSGDRRGRAALTGDLLALEAFALLRLLVGERPRQVRHRLAGRQRPRIGEGTSVRLASARHEGGEEKWTDDESRARDACSVH